MKFYTDSCKKPIRLYLMEIGKMKKILLLANLTNHTFIRKRYKQISKFLLAINETFLKKMTKASD